MKCLNIFVYRRNTFKLCDKVEVNKILIDHSDGVVCIYQSALAKRTSSGFIHILIRRYD